jgi:hypothetical protein
LFALILFPRAVESARRKLIGRMTWTPTARGPGRSEMTGHPLSGSKPAKGMNPMSAAGRARGKDHSPDQAAKARAAG